MLKIFTRPGRWSVIHGNSVFEKTKIIACRVLWREICFFAAQSGNSFDFLYLEQGLHNTPDILREKVQEAIDGTDADYSAILLGYGLCSSGIVGLQARDIPLVIVRGHDCITHLLGSKESYRDYFDRHPGTYWYSPGWIETGTQPGRERYEKTLREYIEKYGEDNAEYLMEMEQGWFHEYNNAAYIDMGITDGSSYKKFTRECAEWLKWHYDELRGDPQLIKDWLEGNWTDDRFLIVKPGQTVAASYDDTIIQAV